MSFLSFLSFGFLRHQKDGRRCGNSKKPAESSHQEHPSATTIEDLPVEMLQMIVSFLSPDSAACFVLCSKSLQWAIGHRSWLDLQTKDQGKARMSFLALLQRDLREWLPCYHCEKLHPFSIEPFPRKPFFYTRWRFHDEHPCTDADGFLWLLPQFGLRFQYAQMIMKIHKLRTTENIFLDSLSRDHSCRDGSHVSRCHTSARIANDELLVKLEWKIFIRHGVGFRISGLCRNICPHWTCVMNDDNLTKRIRCQMSHGPGQTCPECTGMIQCQFCSTEFIMAFLDSNWSPKGQAIYITVWKNLGPCDTPFQIHWRAQIRPIFSSLPAPTCSVPFVPGSIRREFEDFADSRIRVNRFSSKWRLNSDVEFSRIVADTVR